MTELEAVKKTRELWSWLAETGSRHKRDWPGGSLVSVTHGCFLCQLLENKGLEVDHRDCEKHCPLAKHFGESCNALDSVFDRWNSTASTTTRKAVAAVIVDFCDKYIEDHKPPKITAYKIFRVEDGKLVSQFQAGDLMKIYEPYGQYTWPGGIYVYPTMDAYKRHDYVMLIGNTGRLYTDVQPISVWEVSYGADTQTNIVSDTCTIVKGPVRLVRELERYVLIIEPETYKRQAFLAVGA